jgi:antitoxin (DNA-binding transcriptional repressor) of toxin-antitoxin stability system
MTIISVEEFRAHVDQYLAAAANGDVILTQDGKPRVLLRAIPGDGEQDTDDLAASPEFRRMIQQRRQEQGIPWEEARKQLDLD